jgi:hypothetical protein
MSQRTETFCDICGARKGKENGWWRIFVDHETFSVFLFPKSTINKPGNKDCCSENCVVRALSQFMSNEERSPEDEMVEELDEMLKRAPLEKGAN